MGDFASNCPVSRPVNTGWKANWDIGGGMMWSWEHGHFYATEDDLVPIRRPQPITNFVTGILGRIK